MANENKDHYVQDDLQKSLVHNRPQPTTSPPKPRQQSSNTVNSASNSSSGNKKP